MSTGNIRRFRFHALKHVSARMRTKAMPSPNARFWVRVSFTSSHDTAMERSRAALKVTSKDTVECTGVL